MVRQRLAAPPWMRHHAAGGRHIIKEPGDLDVAKLVGQRQRSAPHQNDHQLGGLPPPAFAAAPPFRIVSAHRRTGT